MKLILIRHGEPDYEKDSLTPKGWREAELLSERISKLDVRAFYCSPLGRAKDTASKTLERMHRNAKILDWMQEFPAYRKIPETGEEHVVWDLMPDDWTRRPILYDKDHWFDDAIMQKAGTKQLYREVAEGLDSLLAEHGYRRSGMIYRTEGGNCGTIVLFCHFGVTCVMLSHLLGISAPVLWHGLLLPPASVTTLITEEREKGKAYFRCRGIGDISHLYTAGEPASASGAFDEVYE